MRAGYAGDVPKMTGLTAVERPRTLAHSAYLRLQEAIREGTVTQGELYSESELAETLGMSRTPVREALIALTREGLVEVSPQRGFRIRELSGAEQKEVFDLRSLLESYVARELAVTARPQDTDQLGAVLDRQERLTAPADRVAFLTADEEFHLLMPRLAGLERTDATLAQLRGAMWLIGFEALTRPERNRCVIAEHRAIVGAIAANDSEAAASAVAAHLTNTAAAAGQPAAPGSRPPSTSL